MTLSEVLQQGEMRLETAGIEEAKINAWYLFSHCFRIDRSRYFLQKEEEADSELEAAYENLLEQRAKRVPLEYITHETEFMGLPFYVDEHVLIPRQDTECLVEEVMAVCEGKDVLDLCTGSGCIGISLASMGKCKSVTLADISSDALSVADRNAASNNVLVTVVQGNLFENIKNDYDIIVSNPPYIPTKVVDELMPEVKDHEPRLALDGAEDGLLFYKSIIVESRSFLRENGRLVFEIGYDQGEAVSQLMKEAGFTQVEIKKDLAGLDRIVEGQLCLIN